MDKKIPETHVVCKHFITELQLDILEIKIKQVLKRIAHDQAVRVMK